MAPKLADYILIGNSRAAALVSNKGAIDWCCLPEFDSPSIFAAILDSEIGGFFSINPKSEFRSRQNYLSNSNVAETFFTCEGGEARLLDCFVALPENEKIKTLFPDHEILRIVEGISGEVTFQMEYEPRPFYGKNVANLRDFQKLGIRLYYKENSFTLLSNLESEQINLVNAESKAIAEFKVKAGEQVIFSLSYSAQSPAVLPELEITGFSRLEDTINYWKQWIGKCKYNGVYEAWVRRSALTLKLLTHAPSGAIIAAPTTSLPEKPGGERNWDYRFCWLRDASFTTRVLIKLGFIEEAQAYMDWILHATQLTRPELQVVYSVFGHAHLKEKELGWLKGYENSRPVRIGNGAHKQFQLDVYGEVLDAVFAFAPLAGSFSNATRKFLLGLGEIICRQWNETDNGIWEERSANTHHTHSKVMAWVGLDRLVKLAIAYKWKDAPVQQFQKVAAKIYREVEKHSYNAEIGAYTREFNGRNLDASLLVLPLVDFCEAASPRMLSTTKLIRQKLTENNLVYRYKHVDDGLTGGEGAFGICNFWLAENLAKSGALVEAVEVFEATLKCASPAGLLSEEMDPVTFELAGNYPQGFTHIGLINAALTINEANLKKESAP